MTGTRHPIQSGFTLIELVMVIVILGILAAVALPKFINLGGNARQAVIDGMTGSLRTANAQVYALAATSGQMGATGTVTVDGTTVNTAYGYAATLTDLENAMDLSPSKDFTTVAGPPAAIEMTYATVPAECEAQYTPPTGAGLTPTYVTVDSNC
ncbi:MAG: type II secretion system protein [Acidiferrobacterales bacterium]